MFAAEPVQKEREGKDAEERFGLAAASGHVEQPCGFFVELRVELRCELLDPGCQSRNVRDNESQLKQSPTRAQARTLRIRARECSVEKKPRSIRESFRSRRGRLK